MGPEDEETTVPGPYTKTSREEGLENYYRHKIKLEGNNQLPKDLKKIQLINQEELIRLEKYGFTIN